MQIKLFIDVRNGKMSKLGINKKFYKIKLLN